MKPVLETIDLNAEPKLYTLQEVKSRLPDFDEWEMRNDMVKSVELVSCDHGFLSLGIEYMSGKQGVGYGYRCEGNVGMMALHLAQLLGVYGCNGDILASFAGTPIRVLHKFVAGESVAKCTYIGHFMEDKWMYCQDWIMAGVVKEAAND
jgi:hypothetical protein